MTEIEKLCTEPVFRHFYEISRIPHGSGNEEALGQWLTDWAYDRNIPARRDDAGNVWMERPASPGMEDASPVLLQAHMDMVCEKALEVEHDFTRDPIPWVLKDGVLSTGGRTTLGADDGIGMALAMTMLEDPSLQAPALEVLFTVMEEEDMSGAASFDYSAVRAKKLINLDHVNDREVLCGSCGGMQADVTIPVVPEAIPEGWQCYCLTVSGLRGGHSGEDIHRGRGNAIILLARLLAKLSRRVTCKLGPIRGGTFRLAIPRDAEAVLWMDPKDCDRAETMLREEEPVLRRELPATAGSLQICFRRTKAEAWGTDPSRILQVLMLLPDGIHQMHEVITGVVDTSDNLGEVTLDSKQLHCVLEIRSATESRGEYLLQRMEQLAALCGGTCTSSNRYPGWTYLHNTPLQNLCRKTWQELYGEDPTFLMVHAGLEVGCILQACPDMDAVSIGPNCRDFHSPTEELDIASVRKTETTLRALLKKLGSGDLL